MHCISYHAFHFRPSYRNCFTEKVKAAACFHMKHVFCNAFFKGLKKIDNPYLLLYSI